MGFEDTMRALTLLTKGFHMYRLTGVRVPKVAAPGAVALAIHLATGFFACAQAQVSGKGLLPIVDAPGMKALCDQTLSTARRRVAALEKNRSGLGFLSQWNELDAQVQVADGPASLVANVFTDKATREAAEACSTELASFSSALFQNTRLFANLKAAKPKDAVDAQLKKELIEGFEDTGVSLGGPQRARMKAILDKLEALRQHFDRNVREDATTVTMTPDEVKGMPESWSKALKTDSAGNTVVNLSSPAYVPYMQLGQSEVARERLWRAKQNEGGAKNIDILNEISDLRREMAGLFGLKSYADYLTRRRMVGSTPVVDKFLSDVKTAVDGLEKSELAELNAAKSLVLGKPSTLNRWDHAFYSERLRKERFSIDQEALRKHFPTDASVAFTLKVAADLYGVRFQSAKAPVWHPDVRYIEVFDTASKAFLGGMYLDLFPRADKYNHAAAWGVRGASTALKRNPMSVLVTNFNRDGLTHDELETMLHEFGHVLHGVLSTARYVSLAGTNVKRDFVEAPSQMFEEWGRRADTLALFQAVCATCPPLSAEQVGRLEQARKFGRGNFYARQHLYAAYDMALHGPTRTDAQALWAKMEGDTHLGHVAGTRFVAGFGHVAGGYGASYYGYMWSEVLALDMLSAFKGKLMDPAAGRRYRDIILASGGQRDPMSLVTELLGRAPNSDAFFAELKGAR